MIKNSFRLKTITYINNAIKKNKLSKAIMIIGGETKLRNELLSYIAHGLLCENNTKKIKPCRVCESCIRSKAESNPNIISIYSQTENIKIEQIKEMKYNQNMKNYNNSLKICLIHDCHKLTDAAANAILKLIEEPNKNDFYILSTMSTINIAPTLSSRCCRMFVPYSREINDKETADIRNIIKKINSGTIIERIEAASSLSEEKNLIKKLNEIQYFLIDYSNNLNIKYVELREIIIAIDKAIESLRLHGNIRLEVDKLLLKSWPFIAKESAQKSSIRAEK